MSPDRGDGRCEVREREDHLGATQDSFELPAWTCRDCGFRRCRPRDGASSRGRTPRVRRGNGNHGNNGNNGRQEGHLHDPQHLPRRRPGAGAGRADHPGRGRRRRRDLGRAHGDELPRARRAARQGDRRVGCRPGRAPGGGALAAADPVRPRRTAHRHRPACDRGGVRLPRAAAWRSSTSSAATTRSCTCRRSSTRNCRPTSTRTTPRAARWAPSWTGVSRCAT